MCDSSYIGAESTAFCQAYHRFDSKPDEQYVYFYNALVAPSLLAFFFLFVEASINLTYYKDCVFALVTLFMYEGIYWANVQYRNDGSPTDDLDNLNAVAPDADVGNDFKFNVHFGKVTGDLTDNDAILICNWLTTFIPLCVLWIGATLITDWNSVFYRKAVIYKKRVDEELEMRRDRSTSKSVSSYSSGLDADVPMPSKRNSLGIIVRPSLSIRAPTTKLPEPNFGPQPEAGPIDT